jgi:DNA-binding NarL/FixJ family response regulator
MTLPEPAGEPIRVFVVEDQPKLLRNLTKYLAVRDEVVVVGSAMSGEEAIEILPDHAPQVVLLDLELPGMDGLSVLRHLKPKHPEIEVLILTTFDDETRVYEAIQAGASGYLVKRIAHAQVVEAILEVWRGGTVIESRIAKRFWNYFQSVKAQPPEPDRHGLTETELEIVQFLGKGLSNAEVGEVMRIERRTVRSHLARIYKKLGVSSHVEAVVKALRLGLIDL